MLCCCCAETETVLCSVPLGVSPKVCKLCNLASVLLSKGKEMSTSVSCHHSYVVIFCLPSVFLWIGRMQMLHHYSKAVFTPLKELLFLTCLLIWKATTCSLLISLALGLVNLFPINFCTSITMSLTITIVVSQLILYFFNIRKLLM